ncbi:2-phosphosulfolactate phosphatase [Arachidicoccus ginsenosidimutans]|uniref:2-phosphosulfolactate phosphatase n=1 Tax=Arachidicoccus sp. BS20 TaxID=1850526 RepID=UPI0007F1741D|nr:2-phosphosulfolactate phosphatase [Arachidicoccus sp. BS20]ANI88222.1 2-phosphosulfolactate phosphatase [Arachidicoccus sp. BS20]
MNKPALHTVLSPRLLDLYDLRDSVVVIIDVFRATSTIATALYNGATKVYPVADVQLAIDLGKKLNALTAGERDGKVIEGLQYGNSPAEYSPEIIKDKTLVITTTNGTKLLNMSLQQGAETVITGSFPNLGAVCDFILSENKNVILGCSGWKDRFNLEDTLFAGAVVHHVKNYFTVHCDSSLMAQNMYALHQQDMKQFIRQTTHWHRLAAYGLEKDLEYCVTENVANILPLYNKDSGALTI